MVKAKPLRRMDIQAIRGVAVLLVCLYHGDLAFSGGFLGVDVFMVVSGFVLSQLVISEWRQPGGGFSATKFLLRRVRRLLPALLVVLAGTLALFGLVASPWKISELTIQSVVALFSLSNFYFLRMSDDYFRLGEAGQPLLHTWSLGVEEQIYLLMAIYVWCLAKFVRTSHKQVGKRAVNRQLLFFGLLSLLLFVFLTPASNTLADQLAGRVPSFFRFLINSGAAAFYLPVTRAWQFLLGILCAVRVASDGVRVTSRSVEALVLVVLLSIPSTVSSPGWNALGLIDVSRVSISLVTAVMLLCPVEMLSNVKPLIWLGDRSYSLYLWHYPMLVAAEMLGFKEIAFRVIALTCALLLSHYTFVLVESPYLTSRRQTSISPGVTGFPAKERRVAIGAVIVFAVVFSVVGSYAYVNRRFGATPSLDGQRQKLQGFLEANGCDSNLPNGNASCGQIDKGVVLLLGDSHAWSLAPGFVTAAQATGNRYAVRAFAGCSIYALSSARDVDAKCRELFSEVASEIRDSPPRAILLVMCARYFESCPEGIQESTLRSLVRATSESLARIVSSETEVLVGDPLPILQGELMFSESLLARMLRQRIDGVSLDSERAEIGHQFQAALVDSLKFQNISVRAVRIFDELCVKGSCRTVNSSDQQRFMDRDHLTLEGSLERTQVLVDLLSR